METSEILIEARARRDFAIVLEELLATAKKRELEQLVMGLTSKVEQMEPGEERNQYLRAIQSTRAALKIRFYEPGRSGD